MKTLLITPSKLIGQHLKSLKFKNIKIVIINSGKAEAAMSTYAETSEVDYDLVIYTAFVLGSQQVFEGDLYFPSLTANHDVFLPSESEYDDLRRSIVTEGCDEIPLLSGESIPSYKRSIILKEVFTNRRLLFDIEGATIANIVKDVEIQFYPIVIVSGIITPISTIQTVNLKGFKTDDLNKAALEKIECAVKGIIM